MVDWITELSDEERRQAIIEHWNKRFGKQRGMLVPQPGDTYALCCVKFSRPITPEEWAIFKQAVIDLHPVIEDVRLFAGVTVPSGIVGQEWRYYVSSHLRSELTP